MQEDFKNQLQNTIELWRRKGQGVFEGLLREAKSEIQARLSQQGVSERWPALVNLIQEIAPYMAPSAASIIGRRLEPLAQWLNVSVKNWELYKLELLVSPQSHLIESETWTASSLVAMGELGGRWLIEKHTPPGDLKIRVMQVELVRMGHSLSDCTVRCELDVAEFERAMAQLLKEKRTDFDLTAMILSSNDVLMSQAHFHFELQWAPLLK